MQQQIKMKNNMKQNAYFIAILVFLLAACSSRINYDKELVRADSLMGSQPDSVLRILQEIQLQQLATQADRAYYALLLTQARDKNYIVQTDDSLILTAVHYYDSINDAPKRASAYFYWGNVYRDKNEYPAAIDKYLTSLSHTSPTKDGELCSTLYSSLAYLYYIQDLNTEADSIYHQLETLALQQSDTISLCYSLIQQGMINLEKGKEYYPKAEKQILQALSIGKVFSDSVVLLPIYNSLSTLYCTIPDTAKALQYSRLNYFNRRDTLHCYSAFLYLGNAYFMNAQYDSASIFLQKILTADRYYDTKAEACMFLSQIAQLKGDITTSALMERKRAEYLESARISQQGHATLKTIISHEKDISRAIQYRYLHIIFGVLGIFSIICIGGVLYWRKRNKRYKAEKKEWEEKLLLQKQGNQLPSKKRTCTKEEYKTSTIYIKVKQIVKELARIETKENLSEEEWNQFISLTNDGWNRIITYLNENYDLSTEEIQICCLHLAKVPVIHMGHFIKGQARSTIQLKSKSIVLKMEAPQGMSLKDALFSLTEKLNNSK